MSIHSRAFWKYSRKMRDAEAAVTTREPEPAAVAAAPAPTPPAQAKPAAPFVEQLIFQADSLQAVSRNVETQMKREGIPVLAATREFVELASRPVAPSKPPVRHGLKRTPLASPPIDERREVDRDPDDLSPSVRPLSANLPPVFDVAAAPPPMDNTVIDDAPSSLPYDLSIAPFPGLAHHDDELPPAPIFDVPVPSPLDPPAIVADHVFTDWSDAKNYHGNDHARPYDIDPSIEDDVFAYEAYVPPSERNPAAALGSSSTAETPVAESPETGSPDATGVRNVAIAHVLARITDHYRRRAQDASPRFAEAHQDAALESEVAAPPAQRPIPGHIAHPYLVVVHNNVEIPKVPPYIWSAPELPWHCDDAGKDSLDSWFNCTGNRFQLALDFDL